MVDRIPAMVSMARSQEEKKETLAVDPVSAVPTYPYGLCITLCDEELEKLGLEDDDLQVGDMLHLHCLASVTSYSESDGPSGPHCRAELQIQYINAESEDDENEESEVQGKNKRKDVPSKLYKS